MLEITLDELNIARGSFLNQSGGESNTGAFIWSVTAISELLLRVDKISHFLEPRADQKLNFSDPRANK